MLTQTALGVDLGNNNIENQEKKVAFVDEKSKSSVQFPEIFIPQPPIKSFVFAILDIVRR